MLVFSAYLPPPARLPLTLLWAFRLCCCGGVRWLCQWARPCSCCRRAHTSANGPNS